MNEWSDAEISRRLALAIGWSDDRSAKDGSPDPDVVIFSEDYGKKSWCAVWSIGGWRTFDYRDPAVIWPIAERFDAFPTLRHGRGWLSQIAPLCPAPGFYADTAAKAVALAVIKSKEQT